MADLDVSDVIDSPEFADAMTLIRRTQTVNNNGRASVAETQTAISGVVTQGSGDMLDRLPEGAMLTGNIMVHTRTELIASEGNRVADELIWNGRRYIVAVLSDYSNYGAGFTAALCTVKGISP